MNKLKFLFMIFSFIIGFLSCTKDSQVHNLKVNDNIIENRASNSACTPQSLFTEYVGCVEIIETVPISFALSNTLYSTNSIIANLCPNLTVNVIYKLRRCNILGGGSINFIYDLDYNISSMIAACPALQTEINNQTALGNLVGFLDAIDFDISAQTEYYQAYRDAKLIPPLVPFCNSPNGQLYTVTYVKNTCYRWVPFTPLPTGEDPRPIPAFRKENCESTVCCARATSYCNNGTIENPDILYSNRSFRNFEGTCPINCTHECGVPSGGDI